MNNPCRRPAAELIDDLPPRVGEQLRVVVIGAGIAGMTAAYQLRGAGHSVVVLEARLRAGGRVHTVRSPFADGMHAEAGALFIPAEHQFLMKYIAVTGFAEQLQPVRADQLGGYFYLHGQRYLETATGPALWSTGDCLEPASWPGDLHEAEKRLSIEDIGDMYFDRIPGGWGGDPSGLGWLPEHLRQFDKQNLRHFLADLGASPDAAEMMRATHFASLGDNGRTISPLFALQQWADTRQIGSASTWNVIPGGNDRWALQLASMLGDVIRYGAEVVSLEQHAEEVTVGVRHGGSMTSVSVDHVICALPFSCLRQIAMRPQLSVEKARVVSELQSTDVGHLFIQCRRRVWRRDDGQGLAAFSATDSDLACLLRDATFNQEGERAILDLYLVGPQLERMAALSEDQRLPVALAELENMFPGISAVAEGAVFFSWSDERYSRGGYIWYAEDQFNDLWPYVSLPEGRVHFAGDQTSAKSGWQDGAIASAHRAAREVVDAAN